ncbi:Excitatory amino acid transporter 3 [Holothuria leucospilota]|uniref:Excitatory amino acid transporter 3 n=1 Tax=Holothuria leucospilota TaxID=206669 RepID=A0A9Q1C8W8_HOLLE|nr:Excitatory amino acid transporter 3 [Holothuria leucospilota]
MDSILYESDSEKSSQASSAKKSKKWVTPADILLTLLVTSVVCGFLAGWLIGRNKTFTADEIFYITFPGTMFMNMLSMLIVPLIVSSLISSLASLDSVISGKLGLRALVYYLTTTIIAVLIGITLVMTIKPGERSDGEPTAEENSEEFITAYAFLDIIMNMFPSNIVEACFRTYKTQAEEEVISAESLTSGVIFNLTLASGLTISQSLAMMNSKIRKLKSKTKAFQSDLLDSDSVNQDLGYFLTLMQENVVSASTFIDDITATDPTVDTTSIEQLKMQLQETIDTFETFIDGFPDILTNEDLDGIQNFTEKVFKTTNDLQKEMLALTGGLQVSFTDALILDIADPILTTMTSLDYVLYIIDPTGQSLLARSLNNQLMLLIDLGESAVSTERAAQLTRSTNLMTTQMMNIVVGALHSMDARNALSLGYISENLIQMTVNLMYMLDSENALDTEVLDVLSSLLDDVSAVLLDLAKVTSQPKAGDVDNIEELQNLFRDLEAILVDMTSILKTSSDYAVWYNDNVTDTVNTIYVGSYIYNMNIMGLVVFSIAFGVVVGRLGEDGQLVLRFFSATNAAVMQLVGIIMWYGPIGVFFLILGSILTVENWAEFVESVGLFIVTVFCGLVVHGFIVLPLLFLITTRRNPFKFLLGATQALFTALGTSSSAATLPVTTRCLEENNHLDPRVTRFVLPLGATINMDGMALYEALAAIFIAQLNGIPLTFAEVLVISDRFRTMLNVEGDSIGAGIVHYLSIKDLKKTEPRRNDVDLDTIENVNGVILGITLVLTIKPGDRTGMDPSDDVSNDDFNSAYAFLDIILNIFPPNIVEACFRTYKTEAEQEVIPAESLTSGDIYNLTLASGLTISQSLVMMNSKIRKLKSKTTAFQSDLVDNDSVSQDLGNFLTLMQENVVSASTFIDDIAATDPTVDTTSIEQLRIQLEENIDTFETFIDGFSDILTNEDLDGIQNFTEKVLKTTNDLQKEMLALTGDLQVPFTDALLLDIADPILTTMTSLDYVLYILDPIGQSLITRRLNNQLMLLIDLGESASSTESAAELTRSINLMTTQMMNIVVGALHSMDARNALNLGYVSENLIQMTVNLMYMLDSENALDNEALDVLSSLLDDVSAVLLDLAKVTTQAKAGSIDNVDQLQSLIRDLDAILVDMTTILKTSSDYVLWYHDNVTDTVNTIYVGRFVDNMNILGLVAFSIAFGVVIGRLGEDGQLVLRFFSATNGAVMTLVGIIMCSATLPITTRCLEENNDINPRVTRFVLPLGATINMDGTGLYEAVAAIYVAQMNGIPLTFAEVVVISDRFRTMVNVEGDSIGAGIVHYLSIKDLKKVESPRDEVALNPPIKIMEHDNGGFDNSIVDDYHDNDLEDIHNKSTENIISDNTYF